MDTTTGRCPAAHPEDPTPCSGPIVVTVADRFGGRDDACEHHGARLLASINGATVHPLPGAPEGAATRVFKAASTTRPFAWRDGPRTQPSQLSDAENAARPGLVIPADLDTWDPSDAQDWLAALHEDPAVTPAELADATRAVNDAILGGGSDL